MGRSPGEGSSYPTQYSGLGNSMDCIVHGVAKSQTRLSPSSIPGSGKAAGEGIGYPLQHSWASLVAQTVKNLPVMQETWVRSLSREDPLEKGKATHSSILAWSPGRPFTNSVQGGDQPPLRDTETEHQPLLRGKGCPSLGSFCCVLSLQVLLPGKSHGWRSLVGCTPWGH